MFLICITCIYNILDSIISFIYVFLEEKWPTQFLQLLRVKFQFRVQLSRKCKTILRSSPPEKYLNTSLGLRRYNICRIFSYNPCTKWYHDMCIGNLIPKTLGQRCTFCGIRAGPVTSIFFPHPHDAAVLLFPLPTE